MQNKQLLNLITASILWSFIPVVVSGLLDEISIFMIIFIRFFFSGIFLFIFALMLIRYNNKRTSEQEMKISLRKLLRFTLHKNRAYHDLKYIYYFTIIGFFGIILMIIFYFFTLKMTSIAFTMIGLQLSIILIAIYEHGFTSEKLDFFKVLYLLILIFTVFIIIYVQLEGGLDFFQEGADTFLWGILCLILYTMFLTFLYIGMSKESYTKEELQFLNFNKNYKIARLLVKLSLIFLIGIALMFPFIMVLYLFPFHEAIITEINLFFHEFTIFYQIIFRWEIIFILIFSTIIPYILLFMANVNWSPYNLTFSQWESILSVIEPICGLFFGVMFANEYFPSEFLIIVIILLIISILLRYAHESRIKVIAFILIRQKQGTIIQNIKLLKLNGVTRVDVLTGTHDLMLNVRTNSINNLYNLINEKLRSLKEIDEIKILFINKINKLESK